MKCFVVFFSNDAALSDSLETPFPQFFYFFKKHFCLYIQTENSHNRYFSPSSFELVDVSHKYQFTQPEHKLYEEPIANIKQDMSGHTAHALIHAAVESSWCQEPREGESR